MHWNHLSSVCMSYWKHLCLSSWIARRLLFGAARALAHAFFPPVYAQATTLLVRDLQATIKASGC